MSAPDWFVDAFRESVPRRSAQRAATRAQADELWGRMERVGWDTHRLLGGQVLPCPMDTDGDGNCPRHRDGCPPVRAKPQKVPTLAIPTVGTTEGMWWRKS